MNNETVLTDNKDVNIQDKPAENDSPISPEFNNDDKNLQPKTGTLSIF